MTKYAIVLTKSVIVLYNKNRLIIKGNGDTCHGENNYNICYR